MKRAIFTISFIICLVMQIQAQILAIREDAESAKKATLHCTGYSEYNINSPNDVQKNSEVIEVMVLKQGKNQYIVSIPSKREEYTCAIKSYRKTNVKEATNRQVVFTNITDDQNNPSFEYIGTINNSGLLNGKFKIIKKNNVKEYSVEKCIFISDNGISYNHYLDKVSYIDNDLLYYFFNSIKVKSSTSSSDNELYSNFSFGIKAGGNYSHFWGKDINHDGLFSYHAGIFFEYKFNDMFAVAPEVLFSAQGGKRKANDWGYNYSGTFHINYINVPLMFKYYITPSFSIDLGPQVGFNIYSKSTIKVDNHKESFDYKDNTKFIDVGVGLGITYYITPEIFAQARYTLGLTKVFKFDSDIKNGNAQISIGYRFNLDNILSY